MARYPRTDDRDERGFAPPLTPGDYHVRIRNVSDTDKNGMFWKFKKNNAQYTLFEFSVKDFPGNRLFDRFVLDTEYEYANIMLGRFKQMLIAVGGDPEKEGDTNELIGKICTVYVKNSEFEGKVYNNIGEYKVCEEDLSESDFPDDDLPF